jgi:hypothetical protein
MLDIISKCVIFASSLIKITMENQNKGAGLSTAIDEVMLVIAERSFGWKEQHISGRQARELVNAPEDAELFVVIKEQEEHVRLGHDERIDLLSIEVELFYFKKPVQQDVVIVVNDINREILPGLRTVVEIKNVGKVPLAYDLEEVINGKLTPLKDDGKVEIKGGEHFFGHVKDGSSS